MPSDESSVDVREADAQSRRREGDARRGPGGWARPAAQGSGLRRRFRRRPSRPGSPMLSSAGTLTTGAVSSRPPGSTPIWRRWPMSCPWTMVWVNQPIGQLRRGYGPSAEDGGRKSDCIHRRHGSCRCGDGRQALPGLGRVRGNTDYVSRVVDTTTTRRRCMLSLASARPSMPMSTW